MKIPRWIIGVLLGGALAVLPACQYDEQSNQCSFADYFLGKDADQDNYGTGCGNLGPDCDDANPNVWVSCDLCLDADADGWYAGCDAYATIPGPDCSDSDSWNWISCDTCQDADSDSWFAGCDDYTHLDGPDCDDADRFHWSDCLTCVDEDGDNYGTGCDLGLDCDDGDLFYTTDCLYFKVLVAPLAPGWGTQLLPPILFSDTVFYQGVSATRVNRYVNATVVANDPDAASLTITLTSLSATNWPRLWLVLRSLEPNAQLLTPPDAENGNTLYFPGGEPVFIFGPLAPAASASVTLDFDRVNPAEGYGFAFDLLLIEDRLVFSAKPDAATPFQLVTIRPDGTGRSQVTDLALHALTATFAPGGERIAFAVSADYYDIWTVHPDGSHLTQVSHGPGSALNPSFSPDGKSLVYDCIGRSPDSNQDICLYDALLEPGGTETVLINGLQSAWPLPLRCWKRFYVGPTARTVDYQQPSCSTDSQAIVNVLLACNGNESCCDGIVGGSNFSTLTCSQAVEKFQTCCGDYTCHRNVQTTIIEWTYCKDIGVGWHQKKVFNPTWSPDGTKIVFEAQHPEKYARYYYLLQNMDPLTGDTIGNPIILNRPWDQPKQTLSNYWITITSSLKWGPDSRHATFDAIRYKYPSFVVDYDGPWILDLEALQGDVSYGGTIGPYLAGPAPFDYAKPVLLSVSGLSQNPTLSAAGDQVVFNYHYSSVWSIVSLPLDINYVVTSTTIEPLVNDGVDNPQPSFMPPLRPGFYR